MKQFKNILESKKLHQLSNHPVHLIDEEGNLSPTALIPFCDLGGNMSAMGVKIDQFHFPVCNSFVSKVVNDQLCYELDPHKYIGKTDDAEDARKLDLLLIIDYNEDRQLEFDDSKGMYNYKKL